MSSGGVLSQPWFVKRSGWGAHVAAAVGALLLHFVLVGAVAWVQSLPEDSFLRRLLLPEPVELTLPEDEKDERLEFMIIEDEPDEEVTNPTHEALASRKARDMVEDERDDKTRPAAEGEGVVDAPYEGAGNPLPRPVVPPGTRPQDGVVPDKAQEKPAPEEEMQAVARKPQIEKIPEPDLENLKSRTENIRQEAVKEKLAQINPDSTGKKNRIERKELVQLPLDVEPDLDVGDFATFKPSEEFKASEDVKEADSKDEKKEYVAGSSLVEKDREEIARQKKRIPQPEEIVERPERKPELPVFKPIGARAERSGLRTKKSTGSAELRGEKNYETLRGRYPEYIQKMALKIRSTWVVMISTLSLYKNGEVIVRFGIAPDGRLSKVEVVRADDGMITQRKICLDAVKVAAPFDPLGEDMLKDLDLFSDIGITFTYR